jgi:hypothetical protein
VDAVRCHNLSGETGDDATQQDSGFRDARAYEVEGGGENDDIEDVVDEAWAVVSL